MGPAGPRSGRGHDDGHPAPPRRPAAKERRRHHACCRPPPQGSRTAAMPSCTAAASLPREGSTRAGEREGPPPPEPPGPAPGATAGGGERKRGRRGPAEEGHELLPGHLPGRRREAVPPPHLPPPPAPRPTSAPVQHQVAATLALQPVHEALDMALLLH
nr:translation initiation factor IF-2-like [Aegilops tauschii subsp. strangulata]